MLMGARDVRFEQVPFRDLLFEDGELAEEAPRHQAGRLLPGVPVALACICLAGTWSMLWFTRAPNLKDPSANQALGFDLREPCDPVNWDPSSSGLPCASPKHLRKEMARLKRAMMNCTAATGNCIRSECCEEEGRQCFGKNSSWAACRTACAVGPDPTDPDWQPWSCKRLGAHVKLASSHCAEAGQDCGPSRCCVDAGARCHAKNSTFASCKASCEPGPALADEWGWQPWSCEVLGPRTPEAAPWVSETCSNSGEDCRSTRCCSSAGMQCFELNVYWAECKARCQTPWSCERLGARTPSLPARTEASVPVPRWVASRCSADGEGCRSSRCCRSAGWQCYEKNNSWAACRSTCDNRSPYLADADWRPWSCRKLGPSWGIARVAAESGAGAPVVASCAGPWEDCSTWRCCEGAGMQCYRKNGFFSECKVNCTAGEDDRCEPLGGRTPASGAVAPSTTPAVASWVEERCAGGDEDCRSVRCCALGGMQCYAKNATSAGCLDSCEPAGDGSGSTSSWSCEELGPRTPSTTTMTRTTTMTTTSTTTACTFFCISVLRASGYERSILEAQLQHGTGITACDEFALFSATNFTLEGVSAVYFESAPVGVSDMGFAANTKVFVNVWDAVERDGRFRQHDWTLKVDPDAVLVPSRLRRHLAPHNHRSVYVANCNGHMYGAVEALSRRALETYFERLDFCREFMWRNWGEDLYMEMCLDRIGVEKAGDFGMVSDARCHGVSCSDPHAAAFHPFKSKEQWESCWSEALLSEGMAGVAGS